MNGPRARWLTALIAGGYLTIGAEVYLSHRGIVAEHPVAWLPIVASPLVAAALLLAALRPTRGPNLIARLLLACSVAIGTAGMWFHNEDLLEHGLDLATLTVTPPPLAPAALVGSGLMGLIVLWPARR